MTEVEIEWPWQYSFPPFFTLQPHAETRAKQIAVWRSLVLEYCKASKQCVLDVREADTFPLFNNSDINRKLDAPFVRAILADLQRTGNAASVDKAKNRWEIYWHTLEEWASIIYDYVNGKGMTNSVLTLYELVNGDDVEDAEFRGLDQDVVIKVLRILESNGKCEVMLFDDSQGVKFF